MAKKRTTSARSGKTPQRFPRRRSRARKPTSRRAITPVERAAASPRPEGLEVAFELRDVGGQMIHDPDARFTFRRLSDNRQIGNQSRRVLKGTPPVFAIPVQTGDVVVCELDLQRYRFARSPVFFRTPGPPISRTSMLFREPLEWTPAFTPWDGLLSAFAGLKSTLEASVDVVLHKSNRSLGKLVGESYDAIAGGDVVLAKTALLNAHYRLRTALEPVTDARSWFSFVKRIVAIDRERFLAFVDAEMETIVTQIHTHIDDFRADYERTPAENHRGNVPASMHGRITSMVSIKSTHRNGNFQLTLTHLSGPEEVLLDADIDENGKLLAHLFDLVKHKFSGGTHPHDIHEILVFQQGTSAGFDLGYQLV